MNRILRIAAITCASLVVLFAVAAGVALVVVDPNDYKPQIEAAALKATGKKLQLQGDLSLSVFPGIRIESGPAFMEDDPSFGSEPFLRVDKISASIALIPLFRGKADIDKVKISGMHLKLAVNENGEKNWNMTEKTPGEPFKAAPEPAPKEDNPASGLSAPLSSIALDSLSVTDAAIVYIDIPAQKDITVTIKELELKNVQIGQKSVLDLDAKIEGLFAEPAALTLSAAFTLPSTLTEGSHITAEGTFANIPFSFQGFAALPTGLSLKGDASLGSINLDKFIPAPARQHAKGGNGGRPFGGEAASASGEKAAAETLRALFLDLHFTAQSITVKNIPVNALEATIKADRGIITAKPISCEVFGPVNTEVSLDARGPVIKSRVVGKWENAEVGPLVKAVSGKTPLTGTLNTTWNVNASGLSWPSASKTLSGKVHINLSEGNIPAAQLIPNGLPGLPSMTLDLTNVRCSSTWNITNGTAENNDLTLQATAISGNGQGSINIPAERIDYKMNITIPTIRELPDLKILPIVVSGPLASPSYMIDQPAVLRQTVKNVLDPSTKVGREVEKGLGKALQKLF